jgi:hypothetical protein
LAGLHGGAAVLWARGTALDGRRGTATEVVPLVGLHVGVRVPLSGPIELALDLDAERAMVHQRFVGDGGVAADMGRYRTSLGLALSVALQ